MDRRKFVKSVSLLAGSLFVPNMAFPGESSYKTIDPKFVHDSKEVLLARMIFGEARQYDMTDVERLVIGYTAINRGSDKKDYNGKDLRSALLTGYCCLKNGNSQKPIVMDPEKNLAERKAWKKCLLISKLILEDKHPQCNIGATLYHTKTMGFPKTWRRERVQEIEGLRKDFRHRFYIEK